MTHRPFSPPSSPPSPKRKAIFGHSLKRLLFDYSEWLDSEELIVNDSGPDADKRTHQELVDQFAEQWSTKRPSLITSSNRAIDDLPSGPLDAEPSSSSSSSAEDELTTALETLKALAHGGQAHERMQAAEILLKYAVDHGLANSNRPTPEPQRQRPIIRNYITLPERPSHDCTPECDC